MIDRTNLLYKCSSSQYEPPYDKTNKMACAPSEDSDQRGHPPRLIRVFVVRMKKAWVLSNPFSAQQRPGGCLGWSESSLGAQSFCWFCREAAHIYPNKKNNIRTTALQLSVEKINMFDCAKSSPWDLSTVVQLIKMAFAVCSITGKCTDAFHKFYTCAFFL